MTDATEANDYEFITYESLDDTQRATIAALA